jgi:hypothetical protein
MLDGTAKPSRKVLEATIGKRAPLWTRLRTYLAGAYGLHPEMSFDGLKYGWAIRYRSGGKTLVTLYPEQGSFTALVVLGKKEADKARKIAGGLSKRVSDVMKQAETRRDGRWLWIKPVTIADIKSIELLLGTKRRPGIP